MTMDFDQVTSICRGCLATNIKMVRAIHYKAEFKDLIGITISPSDVLPQWLCYVCAALLQKCVRFKKQVINSHQTLIQYVMDGKPFACNKGVTSYLSLSNMQHYKIPGTQTEQIEDPFKDTVGVDTEMRLTNSINSVKVEYELELSDNENHVAEEKCREGSTLADVSRDSFTCDLSELDYTATLNCDEQTEQRGLKEPVRSVLHKTDKVKEEVQDDSLCSAYDDNITRDELSIEKQIKLRCKSFIRDEQTQREKKRKQEDTTHTISSKTKSKRTWDRKNACLYCGKLVTNFIRHIKMHHSSEKEVLEVFAINDSDLKVRKKKRQAITDSLRNRGNYLHNSKLSNEGEGQIIPSKRRTKDKNNITTNPISYVTCKTCLGTFKRSTFYKHLKTCKADVEIQGSKQKRALSRESIPLMPELVTVPQILKSSILNKLRNDEVSLVIRNDPLILAFGTRILKKNKGRKSLKPVCSKLRDLANLLLILRLRDPGIKQLKDVIDPEKYEVFMKAVKDMCEFNEDTGFVGKRSIPARLRPAIIACIDILYTQLLMDPNVSTAYQEEVKGKLDEFKNLLACNWQWKIAANTENQENTII